MKAQTIIILWMIFIPVFPAGLFGQTSGEILFQSEGSTFAPLIRLNGTATVLWTFADGTTSSSLNPTKDYGSPASRINRLQVNPWSAVKMINIGYDYSDGGSWDIPYVPDQLVSRVENLSLVQNNLEIWCSSYNQMDTLIFDGFTALHTIECYQSLGVTHVSLVNTPSLSRLCLEDNNLSTLDVSGCTSLADLRGALNNYPAILFSDSCEEIWHICVRDNPQMTHDSLFANMERFPAIAELFIWNDNQSGKFRMSSNHPDRYIYLLADGNHYTSLDLRGSLQNENGGADISFNWNSLKSVNLEGCDQIRYITLAGNWMSSDTVDKILYQIDQFNTSNGTVNLSANGSPTHAGMISKANLESRGWIVSVSYFPDIEVTGNGITIADGDFTPSFSDSTDFGNVTIGDTLTRHFIVRNTGNAVLNGWGPPPNVFIYGADAALFSITDSVHFPIEPNSADTLAITFVPMTKGHFSAEIFITNEDYDEAPYNFGIKANGKFNNDSIIAAYQNVADEILFLTEGESFAPLIQLHQAATVQWTFADSTTSASLNPVKNYGTAASRMNRLKVTPWNALKMINIGFDGSDGGWWLPYVPDQKVSYLQNTALAKDSLKYWCSSYNLLDTLNFDNFTNLEAVECFQSGNVTNVTLKNTPRLRRLCLEDNDLATFDISQSPALEDIRGALNNYSTIRFADSTQNFWHICVRDNPQVTNDSLFSDMSPFPGISELFIWNMNQGGDFRMAQNNATRDIFIMADGNRYSSVDLRGSLQNENGYAEVFFAGNQITSVNVAGCDQIRRLGLAWNDLPSDSVDKVLQEVDVFGTSNGTLYLQDNGIPSPAGIIHMRNLQDRGWEVYVSGPFISVSGNGVNLENGDMTPGLNDLTEFDTIEAGDSVTHQFNVINGGNEPLYLNGTPAVSVSGPGAANFSVTLQPESPVNQWWDPSHIRITYAPIVSGDHTALVSISHNAINTNTPFIFTIHGVSDIRISDTLIGSGSNTCFGSEAILSVAGDGSVVKFENGAVGTLVALQTIYLHPGFLAAKGSHVHAYISTDSLLCPPPMSLIPTRYQPEQEHVTNPPDFRIYPNPNHGRFTLFSENESGEGEITILNIAGKELYTERIDNCQKSIVLNTRLAPGLYMIRIVTSNKYMLSKLVIY